MNFKRSRSRRRLLQCTLAALVSGGLLVPALAAKPAEKPTTATKQAAQADKTKAENKAAKPNKKAAKPAAKAAQKPVAPNPAAVPLPRTRPQFTVASAPNPPATGNLSST